MKSRELAVLFRKYLLPELPGFTYRGPLLFVLPVQALLRGFYIESSGFDRNSFHVWAFVQPLYVPLEHIAFTFGERLRRPTPAEWALTPDSEAAVVADLLTSIKGRGLQFIGYIHSPSDLAHKRSLVNSAPNDPHVAEAVAYSLVLGHEYQDALKALDRLESIVRSHDLSVAWLAQMLERCQSVRERLARDPQEALDLLAEWTAYTRQHLKLPEEVPRPG